jgi:hypothetical protein
MSKTIKDKIFRSLLLRMRQLLALIIIDFTLMGFNHAHFAFEGLRRPSALANLSARRTCK